MWVCVRSHVVIKSSITRAAQLPQFAMGSFKRIMREPPFSSASPKRRRQCLAAISISDDEKGAVGASAAISTKNTNTARVAVGDTGEKTTIADVSVTVAGDAREELENTKPVVMTAVGIADLLTTALRDWRGSRPDVAPPFSVLVMSGGEITSPRGIAFSPHLADGSFPRCKDAVEANLRQLLSTRKAPIFYIGSTTDLIFRWRDIRGNDGCKAGHVYSATARWHAMVVLHRTDNGDCCASMEEAMIKEFCRGSFPNGRCKNISQKALRVTRSSNATHWVYVLLPQI